MEKSPKLSVRPQVAILNINKKPYKIYEGVNTIGCHTNAVVSINDENVDIHHAIIISKEGEHFISDLKSSGKTFVDGTKLVPYKLYELKSGNKVGFGELLTTFELQTSSSQTIDLELHEAPTQVIDHFGVEDLHIATTQIVNWEEDVTSNPIPPPPLFNSSELNDFNDEHLPMLDCPQNLAPESQPNMSMKLSLFEADTQVMPVDGDISDKSPKPSTSFFEADTQVMPLDGDITDKSPEACDKSPKPSTSFFEADTQVMPLDGDKSSEACAKSPQPSTSFFEALDEDITACDKTPEDAMPQQPNSLDCDNSNSNESLELLNFDASSSSTLDTSKKSPEKVSVSAATRTDFADSGSDTEEELEALLNDDSDTDAEVEEITKAATGAVEDSFQRPSISFMDKSIPATQYAAAEDFNDSDIVPCTQAPQATSQEESSTCNTEGSFKLGLTQMMDDDEDAHIFNAPTQRVIAQRNLTLSDDTFCAPTQQVVSEPGGKTLSVVVEQNSTFLEDSGILDSSLSPGAVASNSRTLENLRQYSRRKVSKCSVLSEQAENGFGAEDIEEAVKMAEEMEKVCEKSGPTTLETDEKNGKGRRGNTSIRDLFEKNDEIVQEVEVTVKQVQKSDFIKVAEKPKRFIWKKRGQQASGDSSDSTSKDKDTNSPVEDQMLDVQNNQDPESDKIDETSKKTPDYPENPDSLDTDNENCLASDNNEKTEPRDQQPSVADLENVEQPKEIKDKNQELKVMEEPGPSRRGRIKSDKKPEDPNKDKEDSVQQPLKNFAELKNKNSEVEEKPLKRRRRIKSAESEESPKKTKEKAEKDEPLNEKSLTSKETESWTGEQKPLLHIIFNNSEKAAESKEVQEEPLRRRGRLKPAKSNEPESPKKTRGKKPSSSPEKDLNSLANKEIESTSCDQQLGTNLEAAAELKEADKDIQEQTQRRRGRIKSDKKPEDSNKNKEETESRESVQQPLPHLENVAESEAINTDVQNEPPRHRGRIKSGKSKEPEEEPGTTDSVQQPLLKQPLPDLNNDVESKANKLEPMPRRRLRTKSFDSNADDKEAEGVKTGGKKCGQEDLDSKDMDNLFKDATSNNADDNIIEDKIDKEVEKEPPRRRGRIKSGKSKKSEDEPGTSTDSVQQPLQQPLPDLKNEAESKQVEANKLEPMPQRRLRTKSSDSNAGDKEAQGAKTGREKGGQDGENMDSLFKDATSNNTDDIIDDKMRDAKARRRVRIKSSDSNAPEEKSQKSKNVRGKKRGKEIAISVETADQDNDNNEGTDCKDDIQQPVIMINPLPKRKLRIKSTDSNASGEQGSKKTRGNSQGDQAEETQVPKRIKTTDSATSEKSLGTKNTRGKKRALISDQQPENSASSLESDKSSAGTRKLRGSQGSESSSTTEEVVGKRVRINSARGTTSKKVEVGKGATKRGRGLWVEEVVEGGDAAGDVVKMEDAFKKPRQISPSNLPKPEPDSSEKRASRRTQKNLEKPAEKGRKSKFANVKLELNNSDVDASTSHSSLNSNSPARNDVSDSPASGRRGKRGGDVVDSPQRNPRRQKHKVVFTLMENPMLESQIRQLGGAMGDAVNTCTVLVTESVKRTPKLLSAVGLGKPICSPEWIVESKKAHEFLAPWDHILTDPEAEKKWDFSLKESLNRSRKQKILENYVFFNQCLDKAEPLKAAIESCGGKYLTKLPGTITDKTFVISPSDNKPKLSRLLKNNPQIKILEAEAIVDGVLRQELRFHRHFLN